MGWRIEVLLDCLPAPKGSIASISLEDVSGRVQVLVERLLAPKGSTAASALEDVGGRVQVFWSDCSLLKIRSHLSHHGML